MKVSVSLPEEDVAYLDDYANRTGAATRSSVLHRAIELLRISELEIAYGRAWDEWADTDDAEAWDGASGDGVTDAAR